MLFFSSFCFITNGQNRVLENFDTYSKLLSPEKLYIQTDRDIYNAGDTIWFSGYLINSSLKNEFPESNYIYVELLTQMVEKDAFLNANVEKEGVRERIKIKREGNSFNGFIIVPENSNTSIAILRGYSYWMLNKDPEYMFNKNIEIRNPIKDEYITSLIESKNNDDISYISAGIDNPLKIKSIGKYDIDVQFLPESGHLVEGVQNNIAYKAVDSKGKGVKINGKIYADGAEQLEFESNEYGLGSFTLPILGYVKRLYAIIKNDDSFEKEILLPEAEKVGAIINILPDTSFVIIKSNISTSILDLELQLIISDASEIINCNSKSNIDVEIFDLIITKEVSGSIFIIAPTFSASGNNISFSKESSFLIIAYNLFTYPKMGRVKLPKPYSFDSNSNCSAPSA